MGLFIIGDLHLSFSSDKPMDVFGPKWESHYERIKEDWIARVTQADTVIIAGDISWAINLEEAHADLSWLDALPGKKLLLRGNHDYWWSTLKKMRGKYESIDFIQNNAYVVDGIGIVGTRGWTAPGDTGATEQDVKVFNRECNRLKLSIEALKEKVPIVCVLHFPPFDERGRKTELNRLIEEHEIREVYFGHIHSNYQTVKQGEIDGIDYQLISCDYLDFKLKEIG